MASADPVTVNEGSTTPGDRRRAGAQGTGQHRRAGRVGDTCGGQTLSCAPAPGRASPRSPTATRGCATAPRSPARREHVRRPGGRSGDRSGLHGHRDEQERQRERREQHVDGAPRGPAPVPRPEVKLLSAKVLVSGSSARVPILCAKRLYGMIELTERIVVRRRHHGRTRVRSETVLLGRGLLRADRGPERHDLRAPDEDGEEGARQGETPPAAGHHPDICDGRDGDSGVGPAQRGHTQAPARRRRPLTATSTPPTRPKAGKPVAKAARAQPKGKAPPGATVTKVITDPLTVCDDNQ